MTASNMPEIWFTPSDLKFLKIHVRGPTDWVSFELAGQDGTFGSGEITRTQLDRRVSPVLARLANRLRGERVRSEEDVMRLCGFNAADLEKDRVLATAISGLRCAVADALAKRAQLPLSDYIRAAHDHAGTPARSVQLYANINRSMLADDRGDVPRTPDAFAEMAARAVSDGFSVAKCAPFDECNAPFSRPGLPEAAETGLERVRAAKQVLGGDRTLYVDCHSRFDLASALELGHALKDAGAGWYEEPVNTLEMTDDLRKIHEAATLPVAGAELAYGVDVFKRLIDDDVLDIVMPDVKFCGGPVEAYRIGMELEADRPGSVSMHCPSGPISLLASAHVTAAFGNVLALEHAVYEVEWRHEAMEPFEKIAGGDFFIPDGPGLGGRIDPVAVEIRGETWRE